MVVRMLVGNCSDVYKTSALNEKPIKLLPIKTQITTVHACSFGINDTPIIKIPAEKNVINNTIQ